MFNLKSSVVCFAVFAIWKSLNEILNLRFLGEIGSKLF